MSKLAIIFILLTNNDQLLPATVVSRCQRLELLPLATSEVEAALNSRGNIEPDKARLLARLSHGCLGWALLSATDDSLLELRAERIDSLLNIIKSDYEERFVYAAQLAVQFGQSRGLVQEVLDLWLDFWRDLLLIKVGRSDTITNIDQLATLVDMAKNCSLAQVRAV